MKRFSGFWEISEKEVTSRRGEASGQKLLEKSRHFLPRCFALTANAQYSVIFFQRPPKIH
jgi:hypothetical protein